MNMSNTTLTDLNYSTDCGALLPSVALGNLTSPTAWQYKIKRLLG